MNHTDEVVIPGASLDASIILRQVLASLIAGVTTEVTQSSDLAQVSVNVIAMDTGLKFTFVLPSASAIAGAMTADIIMSDVSRNPVQNKVIKAYVDNKFWTGTAAEYALLENDTDLLCFLSDTNIIMYNGESYSLSAHAHGNLTNEGAIGALEGLVVITGAGGVLETITVDALKELLGASSGMNLLHNGEFASPFNTAGLTIYSTPGECLDRWNLLGGTLTINAGHATLSQAAINTAQLRQMLPVGSYQRLMGQNLTLSVLLDDDAVVYQGSGVIDGVATTIMTVVLDNGYSIRLVVNNASKAAYVEIIGGTSVAAIDLFRTKLEIGATASIEDGVMDAALDWARIKTYALDGTTVMGAFVRYDAAMALDVTQKARVRTSIGAISAADIPAIPNSPDDIGAASLVNGIVPPIEAHCAVIQKTASFTLAAADAEVVLLLDASTPQVVTIPADATYNFPTGTAFNFVWWGAAAWSFAKEAAVYWLLQGGVTSIGAFGGSATFVKVGVNAWWGTCA